MKPAPFSYHAPRTLEEALGLLRDFARQGVDAKVLAGGQSLLPLMNMRLAQPSAILDINRLEEELGWIRREEGQLSLGGMVRHWRLEHSPEVRRLCPLVAEAEPLIGHAQIRSRGTLGGSLVHADPSAELPLVFATLGGAVTLTSLRGSREVAACDFFVTYLTTALEADEILTGAALPAIAERTGQAFEEFSLRHGDFAIVAAAAEVTVDGEGRFARGRLGIGGAGGVPVDAEATLAPLMGERLEAGRLQPALAAIEGIVEPDSDLHASADYRRDLAVVLAARATERAWLRALEAAGL